MTGTAARLYPRLPALLQHAAVSAYGWRQARRRYGAEFDARLDALLASEWLPREQLEARQLDALRELLAHAEARVPAYGRRFREAGVRAGEIGSLTELARLPVLTKEDVRRAPAELVAENANRRSLLERRTSGTTGASLQFYSSTSSLAFQWAVWWRHRIRFGLWPGTWHANFTGQPAVPATVTRPPFWRWNLPLRQAVLSMQTLTPASAPAVARFLGGRAFPLWTGYPSVIHAFVAAADAANVELERGPAVVATGAEAVLDFQRRDIEAFTGARLTDQWGLSEGCGNASQCPEGRYHEDTEFGVLECVDPVELGGGRVRGRIVCTGFASPDFPFVRYDTGDTGIWFGADDPCPCGRASRTLEAIEGRTEDVVVTPEGARVMRFDYLFKDTPSVREAQVVQERTGAITLRIVRRAGYGVAEERHLRDEVARWISPTLAVDFDYPDEIEREPGGKFRAVKSALQERP